MYATLLSLVYLPMLVLLAKMKNSNVHLKPLNVIHMSLLTSAIIEDVLIAYTNYLPILHLLGCSWYHNCQYNAFLRYIPAIHVCLSRGSPVIGSP